MERILPLTYLKAPEVWTYVPQCPPGVNLNEGLATRAWTCGGRICHLVDHDQVLQASHRHERKSQGSFRRCPGAGRRRTTTADRGQRPATSTRGRGLALPGDEAWLIGELRMSGDKKHYLANLTCGGRKSRSNNFTRYYFALYNLGECVYFLLTKEISVDFERPECGDGHPGRGAPRMSDETFWRRSLGFRRHAREVGMKRSADASPPRRRGAFPTPDTRALQNLTTLLGSTLELQYRLHVCQEQLGALANVLDKLDSAVIVTDAIARPMFLNSEAERLVAEDDGLSAECAQLAAAMPAATRRLHDAVAETAIAAPIEGRRLRLERPSGRAPLLLTVLPISRPGEATLGASALRVVIFVDELDEPPAIDFAVIADSFDLTPRECDVATRLTGGSDLTTIAGALRMSYSTVRTHLLHVFEKTGVHSQAALVALLSRFGKFHSESADPSQPFG
jgi:DNA-binding CsgD family transcriptional regulator